MASPIIRNYKSGSIIYFEKDKADEVYVLRSGRVVLTFPALDSGIEVKEDVKIGEFFGVKSALGKFPREETAQVIGEASVLVFKFEDFEDFVSEKTHLIIKMMKVFSKQLRQVHKKLREILGQGDVKNPAYELMNFAEVYHKNQNFNHAAYAYSKYLTYYPNGKYAGRASELIELARRMKPYPVNIPDLVYKPDEFDSDLKIKEMLSSADEVKNNVIENIISKAKGFIQSNQFEQGLEILQKIHLLPNEEKEFHKKLIEKAFYFFGLCNYKLNKIEDAFVQFTNYLKANMNGEYAIDSLMNLGKLSESKGKKEDALLYYKKALSYSKENGNLTNELKSNIARLNG